MTVFFSPHSACVTNFLTHQSRRSSKSQIKCTFITDAPISPLLNNTTCETTTRQHKSSTHLFTLNATQRAPPTAFLKQHIPHTHTYTHIHTHKHTHTYTHIHTHTHTLAHTSRYPLQTSNNTSMLTSAALLIIPHARHIHLVHASKDSHTY